MRVHTIKANFRMPRFFFSVTQYAYAIVLRVRTRRYLRTCVYRTHQYRIRSYVIGRDGRTKATAGIYGRYDVFVRTRDSSFGSSPQPGSLLRHDNTAGKSVYLCTYVWKSCTRRRVSVFAERYVQITIR